MNSISITYSNNSFPYVQITHDGLVLNRHWIKDIDNDFLKGVLYSEIYDIVPDSLIEDIKGYSIPLDQEKDITVVFSYTNCPQVIYNMDN